MLSLEQIKKAYQLKQDKKTIREIATTLQIKNNSEISHSLNAYVLTKEYYEKIIQNTQEDGGSIKDKIAKEFEKIDSEYESINKQNKKLLEREAWLKLFTKNIIYKYKSKDKDLLQRIKKYKEQIDSEAKQIKDENFSLYFDLQKEIKEKLDLKEQLENIKFLIKFKYIFMFFSGGIFTILVLILYKNLV